MIHKFEQSIKRMSVLRWAGSKRLVLNELADRFSTGQPVGTFWEPFGGSLSVALMAQDRIRPKRIVVGDANGSLINFYKIVATRIDDLLEVVRSLRDDYYENRDAFNRAPLESIDHAALFYYLNKTNFNGLFRCNRKGLYNVPWGKIAFKMDEAGLRAFSRRIQSIEFVHADFRSFFALCHGQFAPGDLLYADPPYHRTFAEYNRNGFSEDDHRCLKEACDQARTQGVRIVSSNSDTPFVRSLWSDSYTIEAFANNRSIGPTRGQTMEVLMASI